MSFPRNRETVLIVASFLAIALSGSLGCDDVKIAELPLAVAAKSTGTQSDEAHSAKTGVLIVSHGSRSPEWRKMLDEFQDSVEPQLLALPGISGVKSAFMEYTEPSIATRLKEFDWEGYSDVILVPLLLTVSSHSFDDISTIVGAKEDARTLLTLETQRIERYAPRARITITPLLDFSSLLQENLPRRIFALSQDASREGVVLVAYGDVTYHDEWERFFGRLYNAVQTKTCVAEVRHCWCGHIAEYSKEPTQNAICQILSRHDRAIVIPVLVARDKYFQEELIGGAISELRLADRVAYAADAILPDPSLNEWVVSITRETYATIHKGDIQGREQSR